jgi:hypothetical protein
MRDIMYSQNFKKETPTVITYHNKQAINDLEHVKQVGTFISRDPDLPPFTKDYKRDDLIELNGKLACLFYENKERIK